ncbi:hypothetical protein AKJ45_03050 [candidate division MSBL1 archaeon SCGC-AAA261F19]|uniref:HTH cro/C1-type domain-containing protein n=2 Tax=candidate division MSBL1 TaxID=215777 RepID=A0A133V928_9EURY|nr:hypothetical protein AKJ43_01040 [candidate division MSBL1 archaeon SCGC-AAA261D19]KXB02942.1 hypothetical protein AKJ45_03050 [candidate division MSBL1 archaeon SCGC-AAA261F19]
MKPRCKVVVKQVLPAIQERLVKELIQCHKLSQVEIAEKLGITQAAVSQYLSSSRGAGKAEKILKKED